MPKFALAALAVFALPGAAAASSFASPEPVSSTPSIVTLGAPAATSAPDAPAEADPLLTAALPPIDSPSIVTLGTPAPAAAAVDPTARDEAKTTRAAEAAESRRPEPMPVVIRGDFAEIRGTSGESVPVVESAPEPSEPAPSASGGGAGAAPAQAKDTPEPEPLSPSEMDR